MARTTRAPLRDRRPPHHEACLRAKLFAPYDLVGASRAMHDVFRRAMKASQFRDLPVLISGEKGTPKRRLALAILYLDPARVRMPFFAINCSELGRTLAELHGGDDAAPPANQWDHLLWAARGGTLYLDDIGALDPQLQRALLPVLRRQPAEVRILAATERPEEELVWDGVLNAALAARLGLFRIPLPPLRGRPEDVAAQARHLLLNARADGATTVTDFGPGVLELLQRLPWEGNTAQLEGVLREALAVGSDGTRLQLTDLPAWVRGMRPDTPPPEPPPHPGDQVGVEAETPEEAIELPALEYERRLLSDLLRRQGISEDAPEESVRPDHQISG